LKQIVAYRKALKMTQGQMAEVVGLTSNWYGKKESGKKPWNSNEMQTIIDFIRKTYPDVTCDIFFNEVVPISGIK